MDDRTTQLLREAETKFRIVCNSLPVGLLVVDTAGIIQLVNQKAQALFNLTANDFLGKPIDSILIIPAQTSFFQLSTEIKERGGQMEIDAAKADGERFPIELSLHDFPVQDEQCFLATAMDITERRALQQFKQELMSMVSHDLSAPLSSIQVTLNLLATNTIFTLPDQAHDLVTRAERNAVRLIKLVDNLLTIERLEAGKIELKFELVSVKDLFHESFELVQDHAEERSLQIVVEDCDEDIVVDAGKIEQVIVNLLTNAIKFSPNSSAIELSASDQGQTIKIWVRDKGRGVAQKDQLRIFDRFYQVEGSERFEKDDIRSRSGAGLGLGLAICKSIVVQHGGKIGVDSDGQCGSSFWFVVPKRPASSKGEGGI